MAANNDEETYSVIFAALKHPVRRRILRMLSDEELTYTQMLTELSLDTGHLNYYLDSLGELLAKTDDGKYRLSEFGRAALGLMDGVEEPKDGMRETEKSSRRRTIKLVLIPVIALIIAGLILMNVSYFSSYANTRTGSLDIDDLLVVQPNGNTTIFDSVDVDRFPEDTLTTRYKTFFQISIAYTNVSLQIQLTELAEHMGQPGENFDQLPILIYNETREGPYPAYGNLLSYSIDVPIVSPKEKGFVLSGFAFYATTVTNLGRERGIQERYSEGASDSSQNHTGSFCLQTSCLVIEETTYPYFYFGIGLLVLASLTVVLPFIPTSIKKRLKAPVNRLKHNKIKREVTHKKTSASYSVSLTR
jgi:DNA-binding transcriptional ArsR family regulator